MNKLTIAIKLLVALAALLVMGGCATIAGGTHQSLHVQTAYNGAEVTGVHCTLRNNKGSYDVTTPGSIEVHKGSLMQTTCRDEKYPEGFAASFPNQNGATYGNILVGGIIGIGVDAMSGASNTYNDTVRVEMGRKLFWYKDEKAIDFDTNPDEVESRTQRSAFTYALKQYKKSEVE